MQKNSHGLKRFTYDHTLYHAKDNNVDRVFILATQVEDYLYTGTEKRMQAFKSFLKDTLKVRKIARSHVLLMGCDIQSHEEGSVTL